jgi:hypothetical protein
LLAEAQEGAAVDELVDLVLALPDKAAVEEGGK